MTNKRLKQILLSGFTFAVLLVTLVWWSNHGATASGTFFAMGTFFELTVTGKKPETLIQAAKDEVARVEALTGYGPDSDIAEINRWAGKREVPVSEDTLTLLTTITDYFKTLSGAFDPTISPLVELWGFNRADDQPRRPQPEQIRAILPLIDFEKVRIDTQAKTVFLTQPGMKLDLGGIAKGYAIDRIYQLWRDQGVSSALINGGSSSIRVIGEKSATATWNLGIGHPRQAGALLGVIKLPNDRALGTSADTQNFFIEDGTRYSHLLNPKTGYPESNKILITVTAPTATEADLLSTAFFIMPLAKISAYLNAHPEIGVVLYDGTQAPRVLNEPNFTPSG